MKILDKLIVIMVDYYYSFWVMVANFSLDRLSGRKILNPDKFDEEQCQEFIGLFNKVLPEDYAEYKKKEEPPIELPRDNKFDNKTYSELLKEYAPEYGEYSPNRKHITQDHFAGNGTLNDNFTNRPMTVFVPKNIFVDDAKDTTILYKTPTKTFTELSKAIKTKKKATKKTAKTKGRKK